MTEAEKLEALAVRCEQATGADRAIDADIEVAVAGFPERAYQQKNSMRPRGAPALDRMEWLQSWGVLRFTASVDAAMTLAADERLRQFGGVAGMIREAMARLSTQFALHIRFWPDDQNYTEWLARFVAAAALRSRAKGSQL